MTWCTFCDNYSTTWALYYRTGWDTKNAIHRGVSGPHQKTIQRIQGPGVGRQGNRGKLIYVFQTFSLLSYRQISSVDKDMVTQSNTVPYVIWSIYLGLIISVLTVGGCPLQPDIMQEVFISEKTKSFYCTRTSGRSAPLVLVPVPIIQMLVTTPVTTPVAACRCLSPLVAACHQLSLLVAACRWC